MRPSRRTTSSAVAVFAIAMVLDFVSILHVALLDRISLFQDWTAFFFFEGGLRRDFPTC